LYRIKAHTHTHTRARARTHTHTHTHTHTNIRNTQKNVAVPNVLREIYFSPHTGKTYPDSSGNCPSVSCATAVRFSCLLRGRGASCQDGVAAGEGFLCAPLEMSRSVITVQREFRARFEKDAPHQNVLFKLSKELTLHCNHRSGHLKTQYTESLLLSLRHLGNWPRGPAVSMRSELL
jgi:hypothetical protein